MVAKNFLSKINCKREVCPPCLRSLSPRPPDRLRLVPALKPASAARSPCPASSRSLRLCPGRHPDRPLLRPRLRPPPASRGGSCDVSRGTYGSPWLSGSTPDCVQALQPKQKRGEGEPRLDSIPRSALRWGCMRARQSCVKQIQVARGAQPKHQPRSPLDVMLTFLLLLPVSAAGPSSLPVQHRGGRLRNRSRRLGLHRRMQAAAPRRRS
jgi:hypothetical protein